MSEQQSKSCPLDGAIYTFRSLGKIYTGVGNTIADCLSRQPAQTQVSRDSEKDSSDDSINQELAVIQLQPEEEGNLSEWTNWIREAQRNDPYTQKLVQPKSRLYNKRVGIVRKKLPEVSSDRVVIPDNIAWEFTKKVHLFLLHFGMDKVVNFINRYFSMHILDRIARDVVASCRACIASKYYTRPTVGEQ